jgi:alanine racemase
MLSGRPTWAEIDLSAVAANVRYIKSLLAPGVRFCAVIKADGYGHGAVAVARTVLEAGADYLAVAILDEALILREAGFTEPLLILGYTPSLAAPLAAANRVTQTIFNLEQAKALSAAASELNLSTKVHLKVDTGMGRLGATTPQAAGELAAAVSRLPGIELEGAFTHFAQADTLDKAHALTQFSKFLETLTAVSEKGVKLAIRHASNSAAAIELPETHLDMVRVGICLYGLRPSDESAQNASLKPAMKFKTRVAMLKDVPAGTTISYGSTYVTPGPARIATLPVGYADGWTRMLTGKAGVSIGGRRAPIIGRICMDQCMADVTAIPKIKTGDEVLLFGGPELPAEEVARHLGTINYEVVCMVGKRVPRIYI